MNNKKIKSFTDLKVWQEGHKLVIMIYQITKKFPEEERYGLTSQTRRCTVSITSNIAEGFGRRTYKEKAQFYYQAQGSLIELKNQILIAKDIQNIGTGDAKNVIITDPIPQGATYVAGSADATAGSFDGTQVVWNIGEVKAGGSGSVGFQVRVE